MDAPCGVGADFHLVDGSSSYIIPIGATAAAVFGRKTTRLVSGSLLTLLRGQWLAAPWHVLLTLKLEGYGGRTGESMVAVELAVAEEAEEQTARSPQALQPYRIQLVHDL